MFSEAIVGVRYEAEKRRRVLRGETRRKSPPLGGAASLSKTSLFERDPGDRAGELERLGAAASPVGSGSVGGAGEMGRANA